MDRPSLLVARIDGSDLAFGGTWTYQIAPAAGRSDLTITENGGSQRDLPLHGAVRVRLPRHHGRLHQEPAGANVKPADKREEFVSTRSRIDKLGVKPGTDVLVLGVEADCQFMDELRERGAVVRTGGNKPMDMIFALFRHRNDLRRLPRS
jgi:hypothetical protein